MEFVLSNYLLSIAFFLVALLMLCDRNRSKIIQKQQEEIDELKLEIALIVDMLKKGGN